MSDGKDLVPPEQSRPLTQPEELLEEIPELKREAKRLRAQTAIPVIKAIKDEIIERAKSGKLREDLKDRKLSSLLKDLIIIKQVLEDNMPQVAIFTPPAPASEGKDVTWQRAHSVVGKTETERRRMREAIEAEVEHGQEHEAGRRGQVQGPGEGSPGEGQEPRQG